MTQLYLRRIIAAKGAIWISLTILLAIGCKQNSPDIVFERRVRCEAFAAKAVPDLLERTHYLELYGHTQELTTIFYSPDLQTCVARISQIGSAKGQSFEWFYDVLEHRKLYELQDRDLSYVELVQKADDMEKKLKR